MTWPSRADPHPRRSAGARRRCRGTCPRLAPLRSAPGPGRARAVLYDRRPGPRPLPDRVRPTSRQPGPAGSGLHCHVTLASLGARAALVGSAASPPAGDASPRPRPRHADWSAQHLLAMCNRPQAKQVSSNESPVPGLPCHELSKRAWFESQDIHQK
jgi:hypothetical protein